MNTKKKIQSSGLGLENIGDLSGLLEHPIDSSKLLELSLELIDEDPHQPRTADNPGFSKESINEIAETIKLRGVKSPISVRESQTTPGRYIINHGARRYRGSRQAGKTMIPAFIDNDYNEADQVIENLQRNELTPREIADFIGRELAKGKKKMEIAKEIGKSTAFISQHVTLLDLPDPIAKVFNSGRVKDVTVINELVTAYKQDPQEVNRWLADENQDLTRSMVKLLREQLDVKKDQEDDGGDIENDEDESMDNAKEKRSKVADPSKLKKATVQVKHLDRLARLVINRRPGANGQGWIKYEDDGREVDVDLADVVLVALLEG